jgi:YgiT-type zinc finger domain-containing protein
MICLICRQAEIVEGLVPVRFVSGKTSLTVNRVPAHLCPACGESYVDEAVATRLLQGARETYLVGSMDNIYNYEDLLVRS